MAPPEKRKRPRSEADQIPSKKSKSRGAARRPWNFPPEFYDNLSKIWLTRLALQELNRRNESLFPPKRAVDQIYIEDLALAARKGGRDLARFARSGGPDLSDIKGWPETAIIAPAMASATPSETTRLASAVDEETPPTKEPTVTSKSKRSSAYDGNFEQTLIDHNIYPPLYNFPNDRRPPKPANWEEIRRALKVPRRSLSPSLIPESAFEDFQRKNKTISEGTVMRNVVPLLTGNNANIPNEGHIPFVNLNSLTNGTTVKPIPDFFDGARVGDLDRKVREELENIILPSQKAGIPIAPNFFLEVKGLAGTLNVALGQAVLDGAHGALVMHTLQNYLVDEPIYDGNAYAFSSTLLGGYLDLYAHHMAAPAEPGQSPEYHTTLLKSYALAGDNDVWLEGTGAFRNLRLFAKKWRDQFIKDANARSRGQKAAAAATEDDVARTIEEEEAGGSSPLDFYDCHIFAEPEDDDRETQETRAGLGILDQPNGKDDADDADDAEVAEVATDFAASFASSYTSVSHQDPLHFQRPPKLPRTPPSPSSPRAKKR